MMLQLLSLMEEIAAWLVMAMLGVLVAALVVAGSRRPRGRVSWTAARPAGSEVFLGAVLFGAITAIGQQAQAAGAAWWVAGLVCVLAGAMAMPLLAWAYRHIACSGEIGADTHRH